jgi:hypothetical protein
MLGLYGHARAQPAQKFAAQISTHPFVEESANQQDQVGEHLYEGPGREGNLCTTHPLEDPVWAIYLSPGIPKYRVIRRRLKIDPQGVKQWLRGLEPSSDSETLYHVKKWLQCSR